MRKEGFTLVEIFIVVAILGILVTLAIPNFTAARDRVKKDMCVNNLRQLKLAKEQWALEYDKDYNDTPVAANIDNYIRDGTNSLNCQLDSAHTFATSYNIGNIGTNPSCRISNEHRL
jgi:prepilin-type N-terminal cleavage/methylation domain-containing protein